MTRTLIIGSVALDTVNSPFGSVKEALGGAASYGSMAASYFGDVSMVGVVGNDFPQEHTETFRHRGIDLSGLQVEDGETFRWHGYYERNVNIRHTTTTLLNVFETFQPKLNEDHRKAPFLFLANIVPDLQLNVLNQMDDLKFAAVDTMNFWIEGAKKSLTKVIEKCDLVLMNDEEALQYVETTNLVHAGQELLKVGPRYVVVKKGENGAMIFSGKKIYFIPAVPLPAVKDPTGAGDTFAGGLIGYLSQFDEVTDERLLESVVIGSAMASFVVEDFSVNRLKSITKGDIEARVNQLLEMIDLPLPKFSSIIDRVGSLK